MNRSPKTNDQSLYMFSKSEALAQARSLSKTTRRRKDEEFTLRLVTPQSYAIADYPPPRLDSIGAEQGSTGLTQL